MENQRELQQHVRTAQKTGVLKISQMQLTEIPENIKYISVKLRTLDLSENELIAIPSELMRFTHLKLINVSGNRIDELPSAMAKLIKLETLNAADNLLVTIPPQLAALEKLKLVCLHNNQLKQFPLAFCGLQHLDLLDLARNKIKQIPAGVKNLHAIELNLNQNQLVTIADEIAECPRLKILRLEKNRLEIGGIPVSLLKDSIVSNLAVDGNRFSAKQFAARNGYDAYMERYTAVKKKIF